MTSAQSKPLELVIHVLDEEPDWPESLWLYMPAQATIEDAESLAYQKYLSHAELAAEFHNQHRRFDACSEGYPTDDDGRRFEGEDVEYVRMMQINEFAINPHYWEEES